MSQKLKILVIGPGYPYRNGQSIFLAHLCNKLADEFSVELLNFSMLYPNFLFPGSTQYDDSKDKKVSFPNKRMLSSLNPLTWVKTARYINRSRADIIAIDWWHPFFGPCMYGLSVLLSREMKQRLVFITENVISHEANKSDKILTKLGLKHARCFLALSQSVTDHLHSMFSKKVFRSALPIYDFYESRDQEMFSRADELKEKFGFGPEHTVFLFFGLVRKYKGLDLLLQSFAALLKPEPNARLLIAGEFYEEEAPYTQLVRELGLEPYIKMENRYIQNEEVADYFHACDCVAMPYRSATQSGILSMAYGFRKPVIVTRVGELPALVREEKTGFSVPPLDTAVFTEAMLRFLELHRSGFDFRTEIEDFLQEMDVFQQINDVFRDIHLYISNKS